MSGSQQPIALPRSSKTFALVAWCVLVAFTVGLYAIAIPAIYDVARTVCRGQDCPEWRLSLESAAALEESSISLATYALAGTALSVVSMLGFVAVALLIVWKRFRDTVALFTSGLLVLLGAQLGGLESLSESHPDFGIAISVVGYLAWTGLVLFCFLFPSGHFVPGSTRWVAAFWVVIEFPYWFFPGTPLDTETWHPLASALIFLGVTIAIVFSQVYRYSRVSGAQERQQTKWVVFGITVAITVLVLMQLISSVAPNSSTSTFYELIGVAVIPIMFLLVPATIALSILRYRLWDIDVVINRALVYAMLTACIIGIYVLGVGYLGDVLQTGNNLIISLIITGIVAVLFQPLRERLQRGVNRLMYGERDEPYRMLTRLGERVESALAPDSVLPIVAQTVREGLNLPYVAVEIRHGHDFSVAAESGTPVERGLGLPLIYQGETVGRLALSPRRGETTLTHSDQRLLDDLTHQIGAAVHAVSLAEDARQLSVDLQRSRERLVNAREEERRRLRRDLHDGLGPQLASLSMKAEAARDLQEIDPAQSRALLNDLIDQTVNAVSDIRRLVYALRPPALDALGLEGSLRSHVDQLDHGDTHVRIEMSAPLPPLPAAVEVAAYRIAIEGLYNAVRHASAQRCVIRLECDEAGTVLNVSVFDDGIGLPEPYTPGVGISSMKERAEELGGWCSVERLPVGGTLVHARLRCRPNESGDLQN